jgi:hypothetical protein
MAKRGRQSLAALTVQQASIGVAQRLLPPAILNDAEMEVWHEVVNDQPAASFTPTHSPMLELYCRHVVQSRIIAQQLQNFDPEWMADEDGLKRYDRLLAMQEREGRAASSLATRLRITRQAIDQQTVARSLKNQPKGLKPWELPALESE